MCVICYLICDCGVLPQQALHSRSQKFVSLSLRKKNSNVPNDSAGGTFPRPSSARTGMGSTGCQAPAALCLLHPRGAGAERARRRRRRSATRALRSRKRPRPLRQTVAQSGKKARPRPSWSVSCFTCTYTTTSCIVVLFRGARVVCSIRPRYAVFPFAVTYVALLRLGGESLSGRQWPVRATCRHVFSPSV